MKAMLKFIMTIILLFGLVVSAYAIETTISDGVPGLTYRVVVSDTAQSIASNVLTYLGVTAKGAIISVETYSVRFAFGGTTPTQGASGIGHLVAANGGIRIYGYSALANLKYINATNGSVGILQITPLY